jgi:hypothetical protein
MTDVEESVQGATTQGAFGASLKRNNKQIRDDRAEAISRSSRLKYKRKIEDFEELLISMKTERDNMLDLSPSNAQSLELASNFDAEKYSNNDLELSVKIRDSTIRMNIAKERFNYLFGAVYEIKGEI